VVLAIAGMGGLTGAVLSGRALLRKRYAPTPYDDLLALTKDRDAAAQIGETVLAHIEPFEPEDTAAALRSHMRGRALAEVAVEDAKAAEVVEAGGWVLPKSVAVICALAAKAAG
jgi:hypothetical protein